MAEPDDSLEYAKSGLPATIITIYQENKITYLGSLPVSEED